MSLQPTVTISGDFQCREVLFWDLRTVTVDDCHCSRRQYNRSPLCNYLCMAEKNSDKRVALYLRIYCSSEQLQRPSCNPRPNFGEVICHPTNDNGKKGLRREKEGRKEGARRRARSKLSHLHLSGKRHGAHRQHSVS